MSDLTRIREGYVDITARTQASFGAGEETVKIERRKSSLRAEPSVRRASFARQLLCTVSWASFLPFLAIDPALAQQVPEQASIDRRMLRGANGTAGRAGFFGVERHATDGAAGPGIYLENSLSSSKEATKGSAVIIGSTGGYGGDGPSTGFTDVDGGHGGKGGEVFVTQTGSLSGLGEQKGPPLPGTLNDPWFHRDPRWSGAKGTSLLLLYSHGGNGGDSNAAMGRGGAGGTVRLDLLGSIQTEGANYAGAWARSLGGDAGGGGTSRDQVTNLTGGVGGRVSIDVKTASTIVTSGASATGIIAESLGGAGSTRGNAFFSKAYTSNGGAGGLVEVTNSGSITINGSSSAGILAQSIGGHGGNQEHSGGQPGGAGGKGGIVKLTQWGGILTRGEYSFGVVAQSLGGTGGRGGGGVFGGGDGGMAGAGDEVIVANYGTIDTHGLGATAMVAQSVGGGNATGAFQLGRIKPGVSTTSGGEGGSTFFGSGGAGGTGGKGGQVMASNLGALSTSGKEAYGMLVQSVGGGGGAGASSQTLGFAVSVAVGGHGGAGGNGGEVFVSRRAAELTGGNFQPGTAPSIITTGEAATGLIAMSVGGGGGVGGAAKASSGGVVASLSIAIGGAGGNGGNGAKVTVDNDSLITTKGRAAIGIQAKSVGGGGGNGGNAASYALAVAPPDLPAVSLSFAVGGKGGKGGSGDEAVVYNRAAISTFGNDATGIEAMSVGGGGGSAGSATTTADMLSGYANIGLAVSVGGAGGGGGSGKAVTVHNYGSIRTAGDFATGIIAQSIGGGGGNGGSGSAQAAPGLSFNDIAKTIASETLPLADSISARVAVGGSGGDGGAGGKIEVENAGLIAATGKNSFGVFAQSVGGGGGNGAGYLASGKGTLSGKLTMGGSGGGGGKGDFVSVTNSAGARIELGGPGTIGIFAQSVGGGGGNGGSFSGSTKKLPEFGEKPAEFIVQVVDELFKVDGLIVSAIGDPNDKKAVEDYKFFDKKSPAQTKIGHAKNVLKIVNILIEKDKSFGERLLKAGGFAVAGVALQKLKSELKSAYKEASSKPKQEFPSIDLTLAFGGSGGTAGEGGVVTVDNYGTIATKADNSWGIFAQSIGGGGGRGGSGVATGNNNINANFTFGADGGKGGKGGDVIVTNTWDIATAGAGSIAVFGQSVGGGGGTGALAASGNSISISSNVRMGGDAGESSPGGTVKITNTGKIETRGREAHAVVAQSIGGGGGAFIFSRPDPTSSSVLAADADQKEALDLTYELLRKVGLVTGDGTSTGGGEENLSTTILPMPTATLAFGGKGGRGGAGGKVELSHSGTIQTHGMGAFGIFAQSIGGGGGFSADASSRGFLEQATKMGAEGGSGGAGGKIELNLGGSASVRTEGDGAHAVFLQSIGGGGGYTGVGYGAPASQGAGFVRDSAASGKGGDIELKMADPQSSFTLATRGKAAHAIFAQSLGGGGGWTFDVNGKAGMAKDGGTTRSRAVGEGGIIKLDTRGQILAFGDDAYGIYLQSGVQKTDGSLDRTRKAGSITIEHAGTIIGGSGQGAGIRIDGGNDENKIVLKSGSHLSAISGTAILGSVHADRLENHGEIIGNVDLARQGNLADDTFINMSGGRYAVASSGYVNVGPNGLFRNDGVFDIGGRARVTGRFEHKGQMIVHFMNPATNNGLSHGQLQVDGSAHIGGDIEPRVSWLLPGNYRIVSATRGVDGFGGVTGPQGNGIPISWAIGREWGSITLTPQAKFDNPAGMTLTRDQGEAAKHLQAAWNAGSKAQGSVFPRFLGIGTPERYGAALDEVSLESTQYVTNTKFKDARLSMRAAMSCPAFESGTTLMREGECVWGRISGDYSRMSPSPDEGGYRQRQTSYRIGGQKEFSPGWFIGATASFARGELDDADGITGSKTDSYDASIAVKRQLGNWLFAASATIGKTEQQNLRAITIDSITAVAKSQSHVEALGGRFRAAYELPFANWYLRPYVDVDALHLRTPAFREFGAEGLDLDVHRQSKTVFAVNPNLEIGSRFELSGGYWARPYATVGFTFLSSDHFTTRASLIGAPSEVGTFESRSRMPDRLLDLGLGLQISSGSGLEFTGEYQAQTGRDFLSHTGSARLAWRF